MKLNRTPQLTCQRDGSTIQYDINEIPYCPTCRRAAKYAGLPDRERKMRHASMLAFVTTSEQDRRP